MKKYTQMITRNVIGQMVNNRLRKSGLLVLLCIILSISAKAQIITTIAGTGTSGEEVLTSSGHATAINLVNPYAVAQDGAGNIYFATYSQLHKLSSDGMLESIAGNGIEGYSGDGGPAIEAQVSRVTAMVVNASGEIFFADQLNHAIRKISPSGIITTVAGTGSAGFSGDGGQATAAELHYPTGLALDASGNMYVGDFGNSTIRKINAAGIISTIAGTGTRAISPPADGGAATSTDIFGAGSVAINSAGEVLYADAYTINKITVGGLFYRISGLGASYGSGIPAIEAGINPTCLCIDASDNIFYTDGGHACIGKIDPSGILTFVAGTGTNEYNGDNIAATAAAVNNPTTLAVDGLGNIIFSDFYNYRIRKIGAPAITGISTLCPGTTATLSNALSGGSWSSSNTSVVTVNSGTGVATGVAAGTATISYIASTGSAVVAITVTSLPSSITGPTSVCENLSTRLSNSTPGGTWSSSNTAIAAINARTGVVTGMSPGTATITYGCGITTSLTVSAYTPAGQIITTVAGSAAYDIAVYGARRNGEAATSVVMVPYASVVDSRGNLYIVQPYENSIHKVTPSGILSIFAGSAGYPDETEGYSGDGGQASAALLSFPNGIAIDAADNIYISDAHNSCIRMVNTSGIITTVAGTGSSGYNGDGIAATAAQLSSPSGVAVDAAGNLYISDQYNYRIRKVSTSGIITTVAGTGIFGDTPDGLYGLLANSARISGPLAIATDAYGDIYFSEGSGSVIRKIDADGIITTVVGYGTPWSARGTSGYSGDGGAATAARLSWVNSMVTDAYGNLFIADANNTAVRRINAAGTITTIAGNGSAGFEGDEGPASAAIFSSLYGIGIDALGNLYVGDTYNNRVRKMSVGEISGDKHICVGLNKTLSHAITGGAWSSSNTAIATVGSTGVVTGIAAGTATISYRINNACVWEGNTTVVTVDTLPSAITGSTTICQGMAGTLSSATIGGTWSSSDGAVAIINERTGIVSGVAPGTAVISYGCGITSTITVTSYTPTPRIITTVAGGGAITAFAAVGGQATAAALGYISRVVTDGSGNMYVANPDDNIIYKIDLAGIFTIVAGTGSAGFSGDGGAATAAELRSPGAIAIDGAGNIYISDVSNQRVRKIDASGIITTVAGNGGERTFEPGVATALGIGAPYSIAASADGDIYIGVYAFIYKVNSAGMLSIFAGTGYPDYGGDNGYAIDARIFGAVGIAVGASGQVYFADQNRIRMVNHAGIISTIAGTGSYGYSGDGGAATAATFASPCDVRTDNAGNVYIVEPAIHAIRKIDLSGIVTTIAGSGTSGYTGDGGAATAATFSYPQGIALAPSGDILIVDGANQVVRKIGFQPITGTPVVCEGATTTLTNSVSSGVWSSSNTAVATINSSTGVVSGIAAGTTTISYTLAGSCVTEGAAVQFVVSPAPSAISGSLSIIEGGTTTLSNATTGGAWSSSDTTIATIDNDGIVTGMSAGTVTVSYTMSVGCGVAASVNVAPFSGIVSLPVGDTIRLTDSVSGGIWVTGDTTIATISSDGVITGIAAGTVVISYIFVSGTDTLVHTTTVTVTFSTCCLATQIKINTGYNPATNSAIAGQEVDLGIAVKDPYWKVTALTTDALSAISDFGATAVAIDSFANVIDTNLTGYSTETWAAYNRSSWITAQNAHGYTTHGSGATYKMTLSRTFRLFAADSVVLDMNVANDNYIESADIDGASISVAQSSIPTDSTFRYFTHIVRTVYLTAGTHQLNFNIVNSDIAGTIYNPWGMNLHGTITSARAHNSMVAEGEPACSAYVVAETTEGTSEVCEGSSALLTNAAAGGTWSSSNTNVTVADGEITGVTAGTAVISYTIANSCWTSVATKTITVIAIPEHDITGTATMCAGTATTLSNDLTGGTWSSSDTSVATADGTTGIIMGVAAGTANISYTAGSGCAVTKTVTVTTVPDVAAIGGPTEICRGMTGTLTDATTGGFWFSLNPSVATINSSGVVTGVTNGLASIVYTVTNTCGTNINYTVISISTAPVAGSLTGASSICTGAETTLSASVSGGDWTSSNSHASVTAGVVAGVSAGTVTISYTVSAACGSVSATKSMTVNATPEAGSISGTATMCTETTTTLTSTVSGGAWSSSNTAIATIGSGTGITTGAAAGTAVITYTRTGECTEGGVRAYKTVTVTTVPDAATISGLATVVVDSTVTLTPSVAGGVWSTAASTVTVGSASGIVSGISAGTATVSYTLTNSCGSAAAVKTVTVTLGDTLAFITGDMAVCFGNTTTLSNTTMGGTWSSSNTAVATIGTLSGIVTGVTTGTARVTYTHTGRMVYATVTVNALPATITGGTAVCAESVTYLSSTSIGGSWASSNTAVATVGTAGAVSGIMAGTATITYTLPTGCTAIATVTVNESPAAITGPSSVCVGNTVTLSNTVSGGVWTSSSSVATIGSGTGIVTGVSSGLGTAIITYSTASGCATIATMSVNTLFANTGTLTVCAGQTTLLNNGGSGGTWSSSNTSIASVDTTGLVTGVNDGSADISYSMSSGCVAVSSVTVSALEATTGPSEVCVGQTVTMSNATVGSGTWSSSHTSKASVGSLSGIVTGVSAGFGTAIITYTSATGCRATATMSVNALFENTGTLSVCAGQSTLLSNAGSGGIWSSSNTAVATVGSTGLVSGVSGGNVDITYSMASGCAAVSSVTVSALEAISGPSVVCVGQSVTLSNATPGSGTWSSSHAARASVGSLSGVVTGVVSGFGTALITYTSAAGCRATSTMSVDALFATTGTLSVCAGQSTYLGNAGSVGTWSSANTTVATVSSTGLVTGIDGGTATIIYTMPSGCAATVTFTVNALTAITGSNNVCAGLTTTLSNSTPGTGTWTSSNTTRATVGTASGIVNGLTAGTVNISYTLSTGCRAITTVTVGSSSATTGTMSVCTGLSSTLGNATSGGTWSSSNSAIASVGSTNGIVTGTAVAGGTAIITYTTASGCAALATVTVNALEATTGGGAICIGQTITLVNGTIGVGNWSSSNTARATVGSATGIVSGVSAGAATISYTLSTGCRAIATVTVGSSSATTGTMSVCNGQTTTLANATTGGTWSSSNPAIASIGSGNGIVTGTGAAGGTAIITYATSSGCAALATVTVNPLEATVGASALCIGQTLSLSNATTGTGVWTSGTTWRATVGSGTGIVTGVAAGTANITYLLPTGCRSVATVTVSLLYSTTGTKLFCAGQSSTLLNYSSGGAWTSADTTVATVGSTGIVSGIGGGTSVISYTISSSCAAVATVTVIAVTPISGPHEVCVGKTITMSGGGTGGSWASSIPSTASINSAGVITGVAAGFGTTTIAYNIPGVTCRATYTVTTNALFANTGTTTVCKGRTTTLANTITGGTWESASTGIAAIGSTGVVTGIADGTSIISYTTPRGCTSMSTFTVNALEEITGLSTVCMGATITLSNTTAGTGTWTTYNSSIATVSSAGIVTGVSAGFGIGTIAYTTSAGCRATATVTVTNCGKYAATSTGGLFAGQDRFSIAPNPNAGAFAVKGTMATATDEAVTLEVVNLLGQVIYSETVIARNGVLDTRITLGNTIANGMYLLNVTAGDVKSVFHIVVQQ